MTWAATNEDMGPGAGEVRLVRADERVVIEATAVGDHMLFATFPAPGPAARGRLALVMEEAVEQALSARGAPPPGVGASSDLDASLSDQLFRARLSGFAGLIIALPSLEGIANLAGTLDAEDSAVLRWWVAAARERAVRLYVDARDRFLGVYGEPVELDVLLRAPDMEVPDSGTRAAPEIAESVAAMELSGELEVAEQQLLPLDLDVLSQPAPDAELDDAADETGAPPHVDEPGDHVEEPDLARAMAAILDDIDEPESADTTGIDEAVDAALEHYAGWATSVEAEATPGPEPVSAVQAIVEEEPPPPKPASKPSAPLHPRASEEWTRWARDLDAARGPKPLAAIERLFVSAYVPLADAVARGIAGPKALDVLAAWSTSFEHSYSEAFDALRVRGKRPSMVLDVPEIAQRIGRLHGARSVQLLIVDGMRFDLGLRVQDRMRVLLGQRAALAERLLLWSALPTTTAIQLELLGRGPDGLKEPINGIESQLPVARGRSAASLRRIKAGHRELTKLDLVESRLAEAGGPLAERLDDLADEVAEIVAEHFLQTPPRTLVMVFGDHGFVLDPLDGGTTAAHQGGASPEEVLVPAFAWLVGDVH